MPLTFPTHAVAVLPLKTWWPRRFDGVALVVGSTAPDLAYALDGSGLPVWPLSHEVRGLVAWCLPVTLLGAWLVRRAAPGIVRQLPALPEPGAPHRWPVTVSSALVGAASHLALDRLEAGAPVAEYVMHVLGAVGLLACAVRIARRPRRPGGPPPRPVPFWTVAGGVTLPLTAVTPFLPAAELAHTTGVRLLCAVAAGLLAASFAVGSPRG